MRTVLLALAGLFVAASGADAQSRKATVIFQTPYVPWPLALEMLANQSGLHYIATDAPLKGMFQVPVEKLGKPMSVGQACTMLRQGLASQNLTLLRGHVSFTVEDKDVKIAWGSRIPRHPRYRFEAPDECGDDEMMEFVVLLQRAERNTVVADLKAILSPAGYLFVSKDNFLYVHDMKERLPRVARLVRQREGGWVGWTSLSVPGTASEMDKNRHAPAVNGASV